mgnify:CR=1 FL=1
MGSASAAAGFCLLIDGNVPVPLSVPQQTLVKGDSRSLSIAAASVVAKVVRDRIMRSLDRLHPGYGFAGHKGYGSAAHRAAIAALGTKVSGTFADAEQGF